AMKPRGLILVLLATGTIAACHAAPAAPPTGVEPPAASATSPRQRLEDAAVYDSNGKSHACERPKQECPAVSADPDFLDKCRMAGFTVRQCGCESFCAGKVETHALHYAED